MDGQGSIAPGTRVGVLLGGMSAERAISTKSGHAVAGALARRGWDVVEVDVGPDLPERLRAERVEAAWIALHGRFGEDGCVQGLLEVMRIPYTGSGPTASAVAMDKHLTKRILEGSGVLLPPHRLWHRGAPLPPDLAYPLVCKTPDGGSTIGTAICPDASRLEATLEACLAHGERILLESYVTGDEITVAMLDGSPLPVVAIRPESGFFDFEAKYTQGRTRYVVPADVPDDVARVAQEAATSAFRTLGLSGVARADFIADAQGRPWFLEVNTVPGMTETSLSPMAAAAVGISFDDLVERVLLGARLHRAVQAP
ncbi:MAG: D-alanine--D-alanine ligase [Deltaproteobacteria bacterium]|nr:D-alanine--D-alanine ligase [Deltaproteobacteria bacterium]